MNYKWLFALGVMDTHCFGYTYMLMYMCASVMNVCNKISLLHTPADYFCYFFDNEVSVQSDI